MLRADLLQGARGSSNMVSLAQAATRLGRSTRAEVPGARGQTPQQAWSQGGAVSLAFALSPAERSQRLGQL